MRGLSRRGLRVCSIDCHPEQPGFRTVYGKTHLCPNPDEQPQEWLAFMIRLAGQIGGRPALISSADQFVTAMAEHAPELDKHYLFLSAAAELQAKLATKEVQYHLAGIHGMPVSRTEYLTTLHGVQAFAESARFPCVMKPVHAREWARLPPEHPFRHQKLALADTPAELEDNYLSVSSITPEVVVQELIEGPDTAKLVYISCYGRNGERLGACMVKEIRTNPIHMGSATVVEPVADPATDALCHNFLRSIGYAGICEIELKRDSRDGCVKMIEANPRASITADAGLYAGVDVGWLHYLDLVGHPITPVMPEPRDFRHILLGRDIATLRSYRKAGLLSWRDLVRSYRPPVVFFDFDLRDWRVTASTLVGIAKALLGPLVRRVFPRRG
jgi:D-aspartate ligase